MRTEPLEKLEQKQATLLAKISSITDMRLGSLTHRFRKCGKSGCRCEDSGHLGHGGWIVSKKVKGKTVMSTVPREELLPTVRRQLEEGRKFREFCAELAAVNDEISRRRLTRNESEANATEKKGGSKKPSKRKSRPKSKS